MSAAGGLSNVEQFLASLQAGNQGIATGSQNLQAQLQARTQAGIAAGANRTQLAVQESRRQGFRELQASQERQAALDAQVRMEQLREGREQQGREIQARQDLEQVRFENEKEMVRIGEQLAEKRRVLEDRREAALKKAMVSSLDEQAAADAEARALAKDMKGLDLALAGLMVQEQANQVKREGLLEQMQREVSNLETARHASREGAKAMLSNSVNRWLEDEFSKDVSWVESLAVRALAKGGPGKAGSVIAEDLSNMLRNWFLPEEQETVGSRRITWPKSMQSSAYVIDKMTAEGAKAFASQAKGSVDGLKASMSDYLGTMLAASIAFKDGSFGGEEDKLEEFENAAVRLRNFLTDEQIQALNDTTREVGAFMENTDAVKELGVDLSGEAKNVLRGTSEAFRGMTFAFDYMRNRRGTRFSGFDTDTKMSEVIPALIKSVAAGSTNGAEFERNLRDVLNLSPGEAERVMRLAEEAKRLGTPEQAEAERQRLQARKGQLDVELDLFTRGVEREAVRTGLETEIEFLEQGQE